VAFIHVPHLVKIGSGGSETWSALFLNIATRKGAFKNTFSTLAIMLST